jgi:hypothetical protein
MVLTALTHTLPLLRTLMLIHALERCCAAERRRISTLLAKPSEARATSEVAW